LVKKGASLLLNNGKKDPYRKGGSGPGEKVGRLKHRLRSNSLKVVAREKEKREAGN